MREHEGEDLSPSAKSRRVEDATGSQDADPGSMPATMTDRPLGAEESAAEPSSREVEEPSGSAEDVCEIALDVYTTDVTRDEQCLWSVLDQCVAEVAARPGQKRRVEVNFRKLGASDREKFRGAMKKEWQSWLERKVTTIVSGKGISKSRTIGSRWVLTREEVVRSGRQVCHSESQIGLSWLSGSRSWPHCHRQSNSP